MVSTNEIAEVAAAIGDPARAAILTALSDGRALTSIELAALAGVTPQTASTHLRRLIDAKLIHVVKQGRYRYHRVAGVEVVRLLEGLMQHVAMGRTDRRSPGTRPINAELRQARTCYDHLAGKVAVAIADALIDRSYIEFDGETGSITEQGSEFFRRAGILGIDGDASAGRSKRPLCRPCLDWSERRPHVAGRLGAAICAHAFQSGWIRRFKSSRAVAVTPQGQVQMAKVYGIV